MRERGKVRHRRSERKTGASGTKGSREKKKRNMNRKPLAQHSRELKTMLTYYRDMILTPTLLLTPKED